MTEHVIKSEEKHCLHQTESNLQKNALGSSMNMRHILQERAKILAQENATQGSPHAEVSVIKFSLGEEYYAFESNYVSRVCYVDHLTQLPTLPKFIAGVLNIHGRIICVINLQELLGLPGNNTSHSDCVIIIKHDKIQLGFLVKAIIDVRRIDLESIQASLPSITGINAEYLRGITSDHLIVLDIAKLISDKRFEIDEQV